MKFIFLFCRYQEGKEFLDVCTYLDPRVKSTPYLTSSGKAALHDEVFRRVVKANIDKCGDSSAGTVVTNVDSRTSSTSSCVLESLLGSSYTTDDTCATSREDSVLLEIKSYLKEAACPMSESPLVW